MHEVTFPWTAKINGDIKYQHWDVTVNLIVCERQIIVEILYFKQLQMLVASLFFLRHLLLLLSFSFAQFPQIF